MRDSDIIERAEHPFWGRIQRRSGNDSWELEFEEGWAGKGIIKIRIYFDDPEDRIAQENYARIKSMWDSLWPCIVERVEIMKTNYGYQEVPINFRDDWIYLRLPKTPIDEGAAWSAMLQAQEAGWLIDFEGWEDAGGQGVF